MKFRDVIIKRIFDILVSLSGLIVLGWFIIGLILLAFMDTGRHGIFKQKRIGQWGKYFDIYKIRTMQCLPDGSLRITAFGRFLRKMKWDELPQLWNVLTGDMSFVGPRPDIPGYADALQGEDRIILAVKPGLTGVASLYFKDEEELLAQQENPSTYNDQVIWPKKIALNKAYINNYSFFKDLRILFKTLAVSFGLK